MANHTITVINKSGGNGNGGGTRAKGKTNFEDGINKTFSKRAINGIQTAKGVSTLSILKKVAPAFLTLEMVKTGINLTTNILEAKTGNTMRYSNIRSAVSLISNPLSMGKTLIWDYGIIQPMVLARQNENLNYDRQLTGNIIYSGNKQKGVF